jgi:hypothetical protein
MLHCSGITALESGGPGIKHRNASSDAYSVFIMWPLQTLFDLQNIITCFVVLGHSLRQIVP